MSLHKAVFTLTANGDGRATSDKRVLSSVASRSALLDSVTLFPAIANAEWREVTIALNELNDLTQEATYSTTWDSTSGLGAQIFFGDTTIFSVLDQGQVDPASGRFRWTPRLSGTTQFGDVPATDILVGRRDIMTNNVRCELNGGYPGDIYTVTMYYETGNW